MNMFKKILVPSALIKISNSCSENDSFRFAGQSVVYRGGESKYQAASSIITSQIQDSKTEYAVRAS